jgi:hypothetical protein
MYLLVPHFFLCLYSFLLISVSHEIHALQDWLIYYEWQVVKKFPHIHEYRALRLPPCGDGGAGGYDVKKYIKCQLALSSTDGMYILHMCTHTHSILSLHKWSCFSFLEYCSIHVLICFLIKKTSFLQIIWISLTLLLIWADRQIGSFLNSNNRSTSGCVWSSASRCIGCALCLQRSTWCSCFRWCCYSDIMGTYRSGHFL